MKHTVKLFILRKKGVFTAIFSFFILLVILSEAKSFIFYGRFLINDFPILIKMNLEQKKEMIDGDLYRFVRYYKQLIPKDAVIYYVPAINIYDSIYSSHPFWAQELYFRRKLEYYFFIRSLLR